MAMVGLRLDHRRCTVDRVRHRVLLIAVSVRISVRAASFHPLHTTPLGAHATASPNPDPS